MLLPTRTFYGKLFSGHSPPSLSQHVGLLHPRYRTLHLAFFNFVMFLPAHSLLLPVRIPGSSSPVLHCFIVYQPLSPAGINHRPAMGVLHTFAHILNGDIRYCLSQLVTLPPVGLGTANHKPFKPDSSAYFSSTVQVSLIWLQ